MPTQTNGKKAEIAAKQFLRNNALTFIEANYSCRHGEIDLIMQEGGQLIFVEVKYRKSSRFGHGFEHVTTQKQQRLVKAAKHYLHSHQLTEKIHCRFDVVSVSGSLDDDNKTLSFRWLKNAFTTN